MDEVVEDSDSNIPVKPVILIRSVLFKNEVERLIRDTCEYVGVSDRLW